MKKNHFVKTLMRIFAIIASISGVLFLFRDKILSCPCVKRFLDLKKDCPICSKLRSYESNDETLEDETDLEEEAFEHAFDLDPATTREYVSLNINSHRVETPEETVEEAVEETVENAAETL